MELISIKKAQGKVGVGRTTFWKLRKRPDFPRPVRISDGKQAFVAEEVDAWIGRLIDERDESARAA